MTNCCRKCMKKFCIKRDTIENCKDCVSEVYNEILKIKMEENNDFRRRQETFNA